MLFGHLDNTENVKLDNSALFINNDTSNQLFIDTQLANLNFSPPLKSGSIQDKTILQPRVVCLTNSSDSSEGFREKLQFRNFSLSKKKRSQILVNDSPISTYTQRDSFEKKLGSNIYPISMVF